MSNEQLVGGGFPGQIESDASSGLGESLRRTDLLALTIKRYQALDNLENDHPGKPAHETYLSDLYSRGILPVLGAMHMWARTISNKDLREVATKSTTTALQSLNTAMDYMDNYAKATGKVPQAVLAAMQEDRNRHIYPNFSTLMDQAREDAISVIAKYWEQASKDGITLAFQRNGTERTFRQEAQLVVQEDQEARLGIDLGPEFRKQLHDPKVRLVVVMLDINSTLNINESFTNLPNLNSATNQMKIFAEQFKRRFPNKKLLIVPNTGRPADYARGVFDMIPATTENRTMGFAEAGGVLFRMKGSGMETHVPVKDELQWQQNLEDIYIHLNKQISGGHLGREHKLSMLSNELAAPAHEGGAFLHTTIPLDGKNAQKVDDVWVQQQVDLWFVGRKKQLEDDLANGNGDPREIQKKLTFLGEMQKVLIVKFNKTAGYVDIFHKDINKFSSSLREFRRMGFDDPAVGQEYSPDQMLVVHIGDTMTDLPPSDRLAQEEPNYGANKVFTVAVGNSAPAFKDAVDARGEYGYLAARYAALCVRDVFLGAERDLEEGMAH